MLAGFGGAVIAAAGEALAAPASPRMSRVTKAATPAIMGPSQPDWAFCSKCKGLYFGDRQSSSVCPAGGTHGGGKSLNYYIFYNVPDPGAQTQSGWSYCDSCKGMYFGNEQSSSVCPAGGTHGGNSYSYWMLYNSGWPSNSQSDWYFCDKCKVLYYYAEEASSVCPAGGYHGGTSLNYTLLYQVQIM